MEVATFDRLGGVTDDRAGDIRRDDASGAELGDDGVADGVEGERGEVAGALLGGLGDAEFFYPRAEGAGWDGAVFLVVGGEGGEDVITGDG